jgi:phosphate transport system substrate-binding protein
MKQAGKTTIPALAMLLAVGSAHAQIVKLDGSSTVYPISEAVAEEFQKAKKNVIKVTVGISGTGGGFKKFCRGEIDIADASRPILKKEMEACAQAGIRFFELPIAYDALTVVVNPKNPLKQVTVADLKAMWEPAAQNRISNWKQVNPAFPDAALKLFGPGADSGTFDYFTEAINGKAKASRGDFTASEDDNVLVQGVQRDTGALAYFGFAYYIENKDKLKAKATCKVAEAVTTARIISITVIGGSEGATRKPKVNTATPRPPIRPSATPPRRMPIRMAVKTSANWIQKSNMLFPPRDDQIIVQRNISHCAIA